MFFFTLKEIQIFALTPVLIGILIYLPPQSNITISLWKYHISYGAPKPVHMWMPSLISVGRAAPQSNQKGRFSQLLEYHLDLLGEEGGV